MAELDAKYGEINREPVKETHRKSELTDYKLDDYDRDIIKRFLKRQGKVEA